MFDYTLHKEIHFPAAGQTAILGPISINLSPAPFVGNQPNYSLAIHWDALPNHTDPSKNITIDLYTSTDGGTTFNRVRTLFTIPGVAGTGAARSSGGRLPQFNDPSSRTYDQRAVAPLPALAQPFHLQISVPSGVGDCTGAWATLDIDNGRPS
jgi:hypothetical protein